MPLLYFPFLKLPYDLFDYILFFLNILDLAILIKAYDSIPYVCDDIRNHVRRRTTALFNKLGDVDVVTSLILRNGMVVSGSRGLGIAEPSISEFVWCSDIDLYAAYGQTSEIDEHLRGERFTAVRRRPAIDAFDEEGYEAHRSGIHSVTTYTKGCIVIDVVESIDASPLTPIFCFHSTAVSPAHKRL